MRADEREQWIRLDVLESLARSQRALALIMESVAASVEASPPLARHIAGNLEAIVKHQQILTSKLTGIPIRVRRIGTPARPWLNPQPGIYKAVKRKPLT
ncbi:hypothetical protein [Paenibacillus aestuarii]|uniref:Uncharacterized protein n=1 Tax=Paenibacillus aestuarii TaxID=516965 RepID=A0ABW0K3D5_9BACL|nr:hypothetical protein [Paenibacillus aestuarii]